MKTAKGINASVAIEKAYYKRLKAFSNKINKSVLFWSLAKYNKAYDKNISTQLNFEFNALLKDWEKKADAFSKSLAKRITRDAENYVNANFASVDNAFNVKSKSKDLKNQLNAIYLRNLNLIKTIPLEIIERYRSAFLNNIGSFDREAIYKQAKEFNLISNRRAKTIARDQTQKAVSGYQRARAQNLGFEFYKWETARDERVSKGKGGHKALNGRIFKYSEPSAVIDSYGNKGNPSERVNCRCVAISIMPEANETFKLVKDSINGDYYILVEK